MPRSIRDSAKSLPNTSTRRGVDTRSWPDRARLRGVDSLSIPQSPKASGSRRKSPPWPKQSLERSRRWKVHVSNFGAVGAKTPRPLSISRSGLMLAGRSCENAGVTDDDKIEQRIMMPPQPSFDQRIVDGAAAARFLNEVIG